MDGSLVIVRQNLLMIVHVGTPNLYASVFFLEICPS